MEDEPQTTGRARAGRGALDAGLRINDPIELRDHADRVYPSRGEDLGPGLITVARPFGLPAVHAGGPSADLLVTWSCTRGIAVLPTRLLDEHEEAGLPLWSMAITGTGWIEQRRHFVRVRAGGPVILRPRDDRPEVEAVTGLLVDVSEAALRCTVGAAPSDGIAANDVEVTAGFGVGDGEFAIPARIGCRRLAAHADQVELVVIFDEPVEDADGLRRQIYARQRRTLRARNGDRSSW